MKELEPKPVEELQEALGVTFSDISLLKMALTHRSYSKTMRSSKMRDNERLEFLGDAVLKLMMSRYLYRTHPEKCEGFMTKIRSKVISDKVISQLALRINLGDYIHFSYGEARAGGGSRVSNLANAFEALLGALYLDQGFEITKKIFLSCYLPLQNKFDDQNFAADYKSTLQEWSQALQLGVPSYTVVNKEGPDHQKIFYVEVSLDQAGKIHTAKGKAFSKKSAEQEAAKRLVEDLGIKV